MLFSTAAMAEEVKTTVVYGLITAALENDTNYLQQHFEEVYQDHGQGQIAEHKLLNDYRAFANAHPGLRDPLDQWVTKYPDSVHAHLARGLYHHAVALQYGSQIDSGSSQVFAKMKLNLALAEQDISAAAQMKQGYAVPYGMLVMVHSTAGSYAAMQQALRIGLDTDPASFTVRSSYLDALSVKDGNDFSEISKFITKGLRYEQKNADLRMLRGYLHAVAAKLQAEAGNSAQALELLNTAQRFGLSAWGQHLVGIAYFHIADFDSARQAFEKSRKNEPGLMVNYLWKGRLLAAHKKYDEAIFWYDQALLLNPEDTNVLLWKGKALIALQEYDRAVSAYEVILSSYGAGNEEISAVYAALLAQSKIASLN
jgi:tetratricopeptide (TPR) repeat protein